MARRIQHQRQRGPGIYNRTLQRKGVDKQSLSRSFLISVVKTMRSKGRWQIVVDGVADPRRFKDFKEFSTTIREDVSKGLISPESHVHVRIITPDVEVSFGATVWWCLRGA